MGANTKGRKSNGEGTIYLNADSGKWIAEITWIGSDGKKNRKRFSGSKKSEVKNKLDEFKKNLIIKGSDVRVGEVLFQDFAESWLQTIQKNSLKPSSFMRKEGVLIHQVYPCIGNIPINEITHSDVQNMVNQLNEQGLSYSTIKKAYESVSGCLKYYRVKTGYNSNPCDGVVLPVAKKKEISTIEFFNIEQVNLIKEEATRQYASGKYVYRLGWCIILLLYTGMRVGELIALKWSDIDFDKRTISITKNAVVVKQDIGGKTQYKIVNQESAKTSSGYRTIPLTNTAIEALMEIKKITGKFEYVICSKNGIQISPRNINRMFHSILRETKISDEFSGQCGVHTLRHTFASMLFMNKCDVKIVSDILGHADTKITENIYIHIIQQQKMEAVNNLDKYSF